MYAFSGTLRAVPFDLGRLEVTGAPVPIIEGVRRSPSPSTLGGIAQFSFSANGSLVYVPGPVSASRSNLDLALVDRNGHGVSLKLEPGPYSVPRVSPDGKRVAFQIDDGKNSNISIYDLSGGTSMRHLTFGGKNRFPVWSPDSAWVAFQSDRDGDLAIFKQRADGSGTAEPLTKPDPDTSHVPDSWSPDGNTLLFEVRKVSSGSLWALSLRDNKARPFGDIQNSNPIDAVFSPDGRWVAYTSRETGKNEVFVRPFPATEEKHQIPRSNDNHAPVWFPDRKDGKELFYVPGPSQRAAVRITVQPSFAFGNAVNPFMGIPANGPAVARNFDMMPDGKHLLVVVPAGQDQKSTASAPQIQVILNWFEDLKRRVPTNH